MTLQLSDLRLTLPGAARPVLDGISLAVPPGARIAIIGDNGSGKTTLARCMAGWHPHNAVHWRGQPWSAHEPGARIAAVQMVGQRPDLQLSGRAPSLRREVAFAPENLARPPEAIARASDAALAAMGLAALAARDCRSLSGGEAQRLAIASALAVGPELLILDEPVTDLDAAARQSLAGHLTRLRPDMAVICLDVHVRPWMRDLCQSFHHLERGQLRPASPELPQPAPAPPPGDPGTAVVLQASGLGFGHPSSPPLFHDVEFTLPQGALAAVVGPNGAGKSSLMRLVSGLARPLRGQLRLLGRDPARVPAADLARMLGMVFQNADRQFLTARVLDEVALARRHLRLPAPEDTARALLRDLELDHLAEAHPFDLDNGARRLVAVAAALAHGPALLILDETQRGLDRRNTARLEALLRRERARGCAVLAVCHDPDFARRNATHELRLEAGSVALHRAGG